MSEVYLPVINFDEDLIPKQPHNTFKFKCVRGCDLCCKENDVALYPFDIMELCNHLQLTSREFHQHYTRFVFDSEAGILRCYLITTPRCVFFKEGCSVYEARPIRCRMFPVGRVFNRDGTVEHYLPKKKCPGFFNTGQKHTIQSWVEGCGIADRKDLIPEWNSFVNEIKSNDKLPLSDKFFIMFFKKIFYDFDNDLVRVIKLAEQPEKHDLPGRMDLLYRLAGLYLYHIEEWKKGYQEFVNAQNGTSGCRGNDSSHKIEPSDNLQ